MRERFRPLYLVSFGVFIQLLVFSPSIFAIPLITGTNLDDNLSGTLGPESIVGLGGNDMIKANAGDDIVRGNEDNDKLWGDSGNDAMSGGIGNDILYGGKGKDRIFGDAGNDTIFSFSNKTFPDDVPDVIYCGAGYDTAHIVTSEGDVAAPLECEKIIKH